MDYIKGGIGSPPAEQGLKPICGYFFFYSKLRKSDLIGEKFMQNF